ncbi:DUF3866 family protein [Paenibacillus doosanensis]|uniref:DUF3866 family protein n=1 Tax=Paenibacillus doosanensis TaxID=1229154 RepID=UPI00217FB217|nr:DUF3866 family protein [Paenibacillus doosanensis]MCS7461599.1 DUF3866 family protein [Paenibacillus doosanensis]
MIDWVAAEVIEAAETEGPAAGKQVVVVRCEDGSVGPAIHYGEQIPVLVPGDRVLLNTTAGKLGLGTGGVHFVHALLSRASRAGGLPAEDQTERGPGHIMKLKYTSLQRPVLAAEEPASPHHEVFAGKRSLEGMPVLIGELHSMLPAAIGRLRQRMHRESAQLRIAYIMTDGGALPLAFSNHVRRLRQLGWLDGTVTYGQAYGGDVETVNKFTALLAAKHILAADLAIVLPGPGTVGTNTLLGFSGTEAGELINAAGLLHGRPVAIPRIGFADRRERHQGISHHTITALLEIALLPAELALPELASAQGAALRQQIERTGLGGKHTVTWHKPAGEEEWLAALEAYGEPIVSMGRGLREDPAFFAAIGAAADRAWSLRSRREG